MAKQTPGPIGSASSCTPPAPPEGWPSTREAAVLMGLEPRQFQDLSIRYKLPKCKVGHSAFYDPQVVAGAIQERARRLAENEALEAQREAKRMETERIEVGRIEEAEIKASAGQDVAEEMAAPGNGMDTGAAVNEAGAAIKVPDVHVSAQPSLSSAQPPSVVEKPVDKTELLRQALAAAQAQTALIDRIVQNIGRMG